MNDVPSAPMDKQPLVTTPYTPTMFSVRVNQKVIFHFISSENCAGNN